MKSSFDVKTHIGAGCSCNMEDKVKTLRGVKDASFDSVNYVLSVEFSEAETNEHEIHQFIEKCGFACSKQKAPHEMAPEEAGAKPGHNYHAMMEQEFQRHFIIGFIFTIPLLILFLTIQQWAEDVLGIILPTFEGLQYALIALGSIVAIYGAFPFYKYVKESLSKGILD